MGYGGIANSLAVEFDTWYNPEDGDLFSDHISIQAVEAGGIIGTGGKTRLSMPRRRPIADGTVHTVKIVYYPRLKFEFAKYFSGTAHLATFMEDYEESRRIGTLVVYVDDLEGDPVFALPFNMASALQLNDGMAFAGFTASTGRNWEKHDILSWYMCEDFRSCSFKLQGQLDFHTENKIFQKNRDDGAMPPVFDTAPVDSTVDAEYSPAEAAKRFVADDGTPQQDYPRP
jgi:hypothetical protein